LLKKSSWGQKAAFNTIKRHIYDFGHLVRRDKKQRTDDRGQKTNDRRWMTPVLAFARKHRGYNVAGGVREGNWEVV